MNLKEKIWEYMGGFGGRKGNRKKYVIKLESQKIKSHLKMESILRYPRYTLHLRLFGVPDRIYIKKRMEIV